MAGAEKVAVTWKVRTGTAVMIVSLILPMLLVGVGAAISILDVVDGEVSQLGPLLLHVLPLLAGLTCGGYCIKEFFGRFSSVTLSRHNAAGLLLMTILFLLAMVKFLGLIGFPGFWDLSDWIIDEDVFPSYLYMISFAVFTAGYGIWRATFAQYRPGTDLKERAESVTKPWKVRSCIAVMLSGSLLSLMYVALVVLESEGGISVVVLTLLIMAGLLIMNMIYCVKQLKGNGDKVSAHRKVLLSLVAVSAAFLVLAFIEETHPEMGEVVASFWAWCEDDFYGFYATTQAVGIAASFAVWQRLTRQPAIQENENQ
ncbi:hypothetical protein LPW11_04020 [Geomonas sp. RF6]|uniref:hypothetical protein n=1 Tax=Geomonas sp. RF6 TaxID=2897342 RepID=UPI001E42EDA8|nr:hypothetical protein [Geomonas sp. RF6]UFS71365.1 hypothetical protein LPW11_04020 [Geomonas sp. RF6]